MTVASSLRRLGGFEQHEVLNRCAGRITISSRNDAIGVVGDGLGANASRKTKVLILGGATAKRER